MRESRKIKGQIRPVDIFFLSLLVVLLLGGTIYYFRVISNSKQSMAAVNQPYEQVEGGEKVLTDYQNGFSLIYPDNWRISETIQSDIEQASESYAFTNLTIGEEEKRVQPGLVAPDLTVTIDILAADIAGADFSLAEFVQELNSSIQVQTANSILMWNRPALMIMGQQDKYYIKRISFVHPENQQIYIITAYSNNNELSQELNEALMQIMESMVLL